ncbi:hypothetical protein B0H63DRAFT_521806 [Podospora didyma]|uniref:Fungal N-terminal domain-containing protein n=1 Tax=Podospora didyma TaxID=330526 RepID=A0AAE0NUA5_9PEZI|nr:hypothetical protein B0H63DRAFT_521806 [Podospora didyma]
MDPLSITVSVVGLLAAAGKAHALLETISLIQNAPTTVRDAERETRHTEIALRSLHRLLQRLDPANERLEMIQVDELRVVLADAMLLFSSFESMLQSLADLSRLRLSISWINYTRQLDEHLGKLERYKSSLTFMLSILQCNSDSEARASQAKLHSLVEQVLAENAQLRQKMQMPQDSFDARSMAKRHLDNDAATVRLGDDDDDNSTTRGPGNTRRDSVRSTVTRARNSIIRFAFENILEGSRAYKRTAHVNECDQSFASSAGLSIFTGYSLADISFLSVIAMPLCTADVSNGRHYVIHEEPDLQVLGETANLGPSAQWILTNQSISDDLEEDSGANKDQPSEAAPSLTEIPATIADFDPVRPGSNIPHSHSASLAALQGALTSPGNDIKYAPSLSESLDEDEGEHLCANCHEVKPSSWVGIDGTSAVLNAMSAPT